MGLLMGMQDLGRPMAPVPPNIYAERPMPPGSARMQGMGQRPRSMQVMHSSGKRIVVFCTPERCNDRIPYYVFVLAFADRGFVSLALMTCMLAKL